MKFVFFMGIVSLMISSACSEQKRSPRLSSEELIGKGCESPDQIELKVGNQSPEFEVVDITASIDGTLIVDEKFETLNYHHFKSFYFKLCPGIHTISASSKKGAAILQKNFETSKDIEFVSLDYWGFDENHTDPKVRIFTFDIIKFSDCQTERCKKSQQAEAELTKKEIERKIEEFNKETTRTNQ